MLKIPREGVPYLHYIETLLKGYWDSCKEFLTLAHVVSAVTAHSVKKYGTPVFETQQLPGPSNVVPFFPGLMASIFLAEPTKELCWKVKVPATPADRPASPLRFSYADVLGPAYGLHPAIHADLSLRAGRELAMPWFGCQNDA